MTGTSDWPRDFERSTGERIVQCTPVTGGDIGDSHRIELAAGHRLFIKHYPNARAGQIRAEADGLRWLAEANAIRVAQVAAFGEDWLALEWIEPGKPGPDYAAELGRKLAALHQYGAPAFGFGANNWIGRLPQSNSPSDDWAEFYRDQRIRPLTERAIAAGRLNTLLIRGLGTLMEAMPRLVGPSEAPARLHGDLWSGNVMCDAEGAPCLFDPAVHAGHREVDLAMMQLFGGFSAATFDAYARVTPLADGANQRISLYQVYPLLVHVCLFGESYAASLASAVETALLQ